MVLRGLAFLVAAVMLIDFCCGAPMEGMLRPQESESRDVKELAGQWTFKLDKDNVGMQQQWWRTPLASRPPTILMPVPASYNDITQDNTLRRHIGLVWYEKQFWVPRGWTGQRVVVRFESVSYAATVWLNNVQVVIHEGGHLPFEADITNVLTFNTTNRLVVAVNNTLTSYTLPPGIVIVQDGKNPMYPKGYTEQQTFFDFYNFAGIDREVFLYTTPSRSWISDITLNYNIRPSGDAEVLYNITVLSGTQGRVKVHSPSVVQIKLFDGNNTLIAQGGSLNGVLVVGKADLHLWNPGKPYLYTLEVTSDADVYRLNSVGIRTIRVTQTQFLINGKPYYFFGVDKHEDSDIRGKGIDEVIVAKDYSMLQWLNVSAFRTSHYPYATQFYDMADLTGTVIIDEAPAVGLADAQFFNSKMLVHHKQVMFEMIRRDKNHPSVVMWNVANEPQSQLPVAKPYFQEIAAYTRSIDPTSRPVTLVNSRDFTQETCAEFFDVACINRYYGWYSDSGQTELIQRQLEWDLNGWFNKYKKPILVSEYGADTIPGLHHDPPFVFTEEFQSEFMEQYHAVFDRYMHRFLIGELIWNFADFRTGQSDIRVAAKNYKGILTRQREPKLAAHLVKRRYSRLRAEWEQ